MLDVFVISATSDVYSHVFNFFNNGYILKYMDITTILSLS